MEQDCTIYKTASFVGKRWTLLILLELYKGQSRLKRYSEIKKGLPEITPKVLSLRLKELATAFPEYSEWINSVLIAGR